MSTFERFTLNNAELEHIHNSFKPLSYQRKFLKNSQELLSNLNDYVEESHNARYREMQMCLYNAAFELAKVKALMAKTAVSFDDGSRAEENCYYSTTEIDYTIHNILLEIAGNIAINEVFAEKDSVGENAEN